MQTNETSQSTEGEELASQSSSLSSVGELLLEERLRQKLTEKKVADELHITMHYIRAIESNSFEKLPSAVFVKGYIKSYALLLGMDVAKVLERYDSFMSDQLDAAKEKTRIQVRKRKDKNRPWVIVSVLAFIGLFTGLWFFSQSSSPEPVQDNSDLTQAPRDRSTDLPQVVSPIVLASESEPQVMVVSELAESNLEQPAAPELDNGEEAQTEPNVTVLSEAVAQMIENEDPASEVLQETEQLVAESRPVDFDEAQSAQLVQVEAVGDDVLTVNFSGMSWIEVSDASQNQLYRDLKEAGDVLEIKGTAPFSILLGDAPFAQLLLNGIAIDITDDIRIDNSARLTVEL